MPLADEEIYAVDMKTRIPLDTPVARRCFSLSRPVINDCVNARHIINEGKDLSKTISPIFFEHLTPSLFRTIRLYVKLVEKRNHAFPNLISKYRRNEFRSVDA